MPTRYPTQREHNGIGIEPIEPRGELEHSVHDVHLINAHQLNNCYFCAIMLLESTCISIYRDRYNDTMIVICHVLHMYNYNHTTNTYTYVATLL